MYLYVSPESYCSVVKGEPLCVLGKCVSKVVHERKLMLILDNHVK